MGAPGGWAVQHTHGDLTACEGLGLLAARASQRRVSSFMKTEPDRSRSDVCSRFWVQPIAGADTARLPALSVAKSHVDHVAQLPGGLATNRRLCLIIRFGEILYKFAHHWRSRWALGMKTPAETICFISLTYAGAARAITISHSRTRLSLHGYRASDHALAESASVERPNVDLVYPSGRYIRHERHQIHCHRMLPT